MTTVSWHNPPTRRRVLLGAACAALPLPAPAQDSRWTAALRRAEGLGQLRCIAISHKGETVVAKAVRGPAPDRPVNVKSVSKTVVAALLGTAIARGEIAGLEATLAEVAPELIPPGADPRVAALTMEQLVTMQAGLERTSGANYGGWVQSPDWVADALSRPFVAEPGTRMLYSTGSFHVLGAALTRATGQSLLALARTRLGGPLDIAIPPWTRDPQDFYLGGNEMRLSALGMLAFGEMYRRGGRGPTGRILPEAWVDDSFAARTRSPWSGMGYGLGWFLGQAGGARYALARGYGGQVICVVPSLELTVALTSDPTRPARSEGYFGDLRALIEQEILTAARST